MTKKRECRVPMAGPVCGDDDDAADDDDGRGAGAGGGGFPLSE